MMETFRPPIGPDAHMLRADSNAYLISLFPRYKTDHFDSYKGGIMQNVFSSEQSRRMIAWGFMGAGILLCMWALPYVIVQVEGTKAAGGIEAFLGVSEWQDNYLFSFWGFSFPIASGILLMGMALRCNLSPKLAIGVPLLFLTMLVWIGYVPSLPDVIPGYFGIAGTIDAICILTSIFLIWTNLRPENPWPGLLRGLSVVSLAATAWFTCGIFSTPGVVVYGEFARSQATITDLTHKVAAAWTASWLLIAASFIMERRAQRARQALDLEKRRPLGSLAD